ncbi:hypothetical protein KP509_08G056700 [Ceratopteris richardii]|uniref:Uncharacterized protein n=1 Tax=Ceratopteris richardii TaxID=49495 RepID=A0A8T2U893_CERRI|nr:hypothetical protein KP509_08G056700 [Ceratopteris richardii]
MKSFPRLCSHSHTSNMYLQMYLFMKQSPRKFNSSNKGEGQRKQQTHEARKKAKATMNLRDPINGSKEECITNKEQEEQRTKAQSTSSKGLKELQSSKNAPPIP